MPQELRAWPPLPSPLGRGCVWLAAAWALASVPARAEAPPTPESRPPLLLVIQAQRPASELLAGAEAALASSKRFRLVLVQGLAPLMQQADEKASVRSRAALLMEDGRKAMVALDHGQAQAKLIEARDLLGQSFMRYYDPAPLAHVRLLLGVLALEQLARPDLAREEFVEVHRLDPAFKLDAHYSPRVRSAFEDARAGLPPAAAPSAQDLVRLAALPRAKAALVLDVQEAGEQSLLQGSLFVVAKGSYTAADSRLVRLADPGHVRRQADALGSLLRRAAEELYPAPRVVVVRPPPKPRPPPPPPPRPWYLRWYTFAAAGVVIAAAVALPLALRERTTDVVVEWP